MCHANDGKLVLGAACYLPDFFDLSLFYLRRRFFWWPAFLVNADGAGFLLFVVLTSCYPLFLGQLIGSVCYD